MNNTKTKEVLICIENLIGEHQQILENLLCQLRTTDDVRIRDAIGFALTDNFKDKTITDCLVELLHDPRWTENKGTILYLLSECTCDPKYLYFLIDLLLKHETDEEIIMGGYSMIIDLKPPFPRDEIAKSLRKLRREDAKVNISKKQRALVRSLINFLEGQREIVSFYKRFGGDN